MSALEKCLEKCINKKVLEDVIIIEKISEDMVTLYLRTGVKISIKTHKNKCIVTSFGLRVLFS